MNKRVHSIIFARKKRRFGDVDLCDSVQICGTVKEWRHRFVRRIKCVVRSMRRSASPERRELSIKTITVKLCSHVQRTSYTDSSRLHSSFSEMVTFIRQ